MTHALHAPARSRSASAARGMVRRWVSRHLVAMDPAPAPGALDLLDAPHPVERTAAPDRGVDCSPARRGRDTA